MVCQDDQKHFDFHTPNAHMTFTADNIQRQDSNPAASAKFAAVVQLRGNVQIRTCCIQAPTSNKNKSAPPPRLVVLMRADEADFNQQTGEMDVRGNVHVNLQNYEPQID